MSKGKEYVKNTVILLVGKFATQFISLFLLPLYTHYLLATDFGLVDLYQTYISLFVPVFLLCMDSAVFRFLIDVRNNVDEMKKIIVTSLKRTFFQSLIFITFAFIFNLMFKLKYFIIIVINAVVIMFSNVMLQICRGLGKNKSYSMACIITASIILISNILLIIILKFNASSILISSSIANIFCIVYLFIKLKIFKYINLNNSSKVKEKEILDYSIPLIPNALSWWIVNASDRTIISTLINTAANGIYTVSCKFSNILNSIFAIFTMSWQESASLHINDDDKDVFFTKMINSIYKFFILISLIIIICVSLAFDFLIGNNYMSSYNYIPILILANSFNVLTGLFGGIYIAKKLTKKLTATTIISALINLIINLLLIKKYGLYAACFSTLISYMLMAIYRYLDVQKYVKVAITFKTIIEIIILFTISFFAYYSRMTVIELLVLLLIVVYSYISNKRIINELLRSIKKFLKK